jgi:predicted porin
MKNKLAVFLIAGTASSVALAQQERVEIYGKLNVSLESVSSPGARTAAGDVARTPRITNNSSIFGFRGTEKISTDLTAVWQLQNSVALDNGTGGIANRNTRIGLQGTFGTVFVGIWDLPFKNSTTRLDPWADQTIGAYTSVMSGHATLALTGNAENRNGFDRRQKNVLYYMSPKVGQLSGALAYSPPEDKRAASATVAGQAPSLVSVSLIYEGGPLYLAVAYERHDEFANTLLEKTKDAGVNLAAQYVFAKQHTVGLAFQRLEYQGNLAGTSLPKTFAAAGARKAQLDTVFASYRGNFGPHIVRASYGQNEEIKVGGIRATGTEARAIAVGYGYTLSKRTELYTTWVTINNGQNSRNDFGTNGAGIATKPASNGSSPRGLSVGMLHTF